ncbi:cup [Haematobia irritans]|uniref:cup n=1 Tax=Haematobia irritans TaxID=7368 RepID=UPI003F50C7E1
MSYCNSVTAIGEHRPNEENGAGAIPFSDGRELMDESSKIVSESKEVVYTPPPPPPSTPVQYKITSKELGNVDALHGSLECAVDELLKMGDPLPTDFKPWKDHSGPPHPPPMPSKPCVYLLKSANGDGLIESNIKMAKSRLKPVLHGRAPKDTVTSTCMALIEMPKKTKLDEMLKIVERNIRIQKLKEKLVLTKPSVISVAIPLPPPSHIPMEYKAEIAALEIECGNGAVKKMQGNYVQQHLQQDNHIEDDGLSLQVLSARSSTPYTQPMSTTAASCDLENVSEHVSPVKDTDGNISKQNIREVRENCKPKKALLTQPKSATVLSTNNSCCRKYSKTKTAENRSNDSLTRYNRAGLLIIRNQMSICSKSKQNDVSPRGTPPTMVNCDVIELEARLKRLNIWKMGDSDVPSTTYSSRNNACSSQATNSNNLKARCNDMMPSFFKRKFMDESIIRSQPPQPLEFKVSTYDIFKIDHN